MKITELIAIRRIILSMSMLFFLSCDDWLPPPTKSGNNSLGCFINGEKFIPKSGGIFSNPHLTVTYQNNLLSIYVSNLQDQPYKYLYIQIRDVSKKGRYNINYDFDSQSSADRPNYAYYHVENESYATSADLPAYINITKLNTSKKIISGTFDFKMKEIHNLNKIVKITKGRFDFSY